MPTDDKRADDLCARCGHELHSHRCDGKCGAVIGFKETDITVTRAVPVTHYDYCDCPGFLEEDGDPNLGPNGEEPLTNWQIHGLDRY